MGACTVPTRLTDADRHGLSLRGAERAAALHLTPPPPPLLPSPAQPFSIEILSSPSSSFEPVPTYPSSLPLHVERSKPVLATTTTATTGPTPRPPHVAPVVITSIHFTLKAGAGALSRNEPRASRIFATDCHTLVHLPPQSFSKFARLQGGERGGLTAVQTRASDSFPRAEFFPEKRKYR